MADDLQNMQRASEYYVDPAASGVAGPHFTPAPGAAPRGSVPTPRQTPDFDRLADIELDLKIVLGRAEMELAEVLKLDSGSVVMLDSLADDHCLLAVYVDRIIATGDRARLVDPRVAAAVQCALGMLSQLAPALAADLTTPPGQTP